MSAIANPMLQRLAAIGILLTLSALAFAALVVPAADHFETLRASITRERELIGRFEAYTANKDAAAEWVERSEAAMRSGIFLGGATDALRSANLQAILTSIAQKHGARLSSTRAIPEEDAGGLRLIGVQAELEADLRQLQSMLLDFETHRPFLLIRSIQLSPVAGGRAGDNALKIRFAVSGVSTQSEASRP